MNTQFCTIARILKHWPWYLIEFADEIMISEAKSSNKVSKFGFNMLTKIVICAGI